MRSIKKQGSNICFGVIVIILAMIPLLYENGIIEASSTVLFIGKCMSFAIVAIGLDLIWGYTGILSLGHGLYFALGSCRQHKVGLLILCILEDSKNYLWCGFRLKHFQ